MSRPRIPFTAKELADMAGSHAAGASFAELGERYGVAPDTVRRRLIEAGLYKLSKQRLRESEHALIAELVHDGWSAPAIAEYLGRNTTTIFAVIREYEIEYTRRAGGVAQPRILNGRRARVSDNTRQAIMRAARRHVTFAEAAREAGVAPATVERVLFEDAPVLLHQLRHPSPRPADTLNRTAGGLAELPDRVREWGLVNELDHDNLVADYGAEYIAGIIDRLTADITAAARLRHGLRKALERASG